MARYAFAWIFILLVVFLVLHLFIIQQLDLKVGRHNFLAVTQNEILAEKSVDTTAETPIVTQPEIETTKSSTVASTKSQETVTCKHETAKPTVKPVSNSKPSTVTDLPTCNFLYEQQILNNKSHTSYKQIDLTLEDFNPSREIDNEILENHLQNLIQTTNITAGGCWTSENYCQVEQTIALIIPYRDREVHKTAFLYYMHRFLQRQHRKYCIILSEQHDKAQFNRGKLMNTGYDFVMRYHEFYQNWSLAGRILNFIF